MLVFYLYDQIDNNNQMLRSEMMAIKLSWLRSVKNTSEMSAIRHVLDQTGKCISRIMAKITFGIRYLIILLIQT